MLDKRGFSLVEMIVVMAIFVIVIGITGYVFNQVVSKGLLQTKTAESNISGIVGLEMMRADIESSGYGIPWSFKGTVNYTEAADAPGVTNLNDNGRTYSDSTQNNIPRAVASDNNVVSGNAAVVLNGTDVLAIRSTSVANNTAARKWSYVESRVLPTVDPNPTPHSWTTEKLATSDRVIELQPVINLKQVNQLVVSPTGTWSAHFDNYSSIGKPPIYNDSEKKSDSYIIYGVDETTDLNFPFNRADYYVRKPAAAEEGWIRLPQRCNQSAGILFKGIVSQSDGTYQQLPLMECVLDMQVVFGLLTPGSDLVTNSDVLNNPSTGNVMTPKEIREQLKEMKVYILTHDGGRDTNFTYPSPTIVVGPGDGTGRTYNFADNGVANWQNYRWRVYQITGRPRNIAGNTE
jgi:prepilin-type N-terminal cleavage/methylation domain-containing protein